MKLNDFKKQLIQDGTECYEVGGCVRDHYDNLYHQSNRIINDLDYVVCGYDIDEFEKTFPDASKVGTEAVIFNNGVEKKEKTPVYLVDLDGEKCEVALARFEQKTGEGYSGFAFSYGKNITILDDLSRRDFTVNAIARNILTDEILDPFNGIEDIQRRKIQGIFIEEPDKKIEGDFAYDQQNKEFLLKKENVVYSSKLPQDPVRALRAARFVAKLGYEVEENTGKALHHLKEELKTVHPNRIYAETKKALLESEPGLYFDQLKEFELLDNFFPEIEDLMGLEQRAEFHPEGDAYVHTKQVALAASVLTKELHPGEKERLEKNVLAAFLHDVGKKPAQAFNEEKKHFTYILHEQKGLPLVDNVIERFQLQRMAEHLKTVTAQHMYPHNNLTKTKTSKVEHFINGGYKRYAIESSVKEKILESTLVPKDLKGISSEEELCSLIQTKESNFKKHQRDFTVSLRFKEVLKDKKVSLKEFKASEDKKSYLRSKCLSEHELEKWDFIAKEKGIKDRMNLDDFLILCASDNLGRLADPVEAKNVFKDAAELMKFSGPPAERKKLLGDWKERFSLEDNYIAEFEQFLDNAALIQQLNSLHRNTNAEVDVPLLQEAGKKPDEIALFKDEKKKTAIRSAYTELKKKPNSLTLN